MIVTLQCAIVHAQDVFLCQIELIYVFFTVMANQSTTTIAIVSPIKSISILMPGFVSTQVQPVIHPRIAPKSEAKKLTPITSKKSKPLVRSVKFSKKRKKDKVENEKETIESTANEVLD